MPSPSSETWTTAPSSLGRVQMVMVPPPTFRESPCLMQFSTSGCRIMLGTCTSSVASSISMRTRSCGPKRIVSMSR